LSYDYSRLQASLPVSRVGKPTDIDGSEVEGLFRDGRISEIAAYCETDGVNTFRVGLNLRSICGDKC
jgi:predicted PolB exonuclease-like 3'-5' exonuclease